MKLLPFFIIMFIFLIIPSVHSQDSNFFQIQASSQTSLCKCGVSSQELFISNIFADDVFTISFKGNGATWVSPNENNFLLKAGESKRVTLNYKVPCDASSYDLTIVVTSLSGQTKEILQNSAVDTCVNMQVISVSTYAANCPCSTLGYSFKVKNTGTFSESYDFKATKFNENFVFVPQSVTLAPQQEVTIQAFLRNKCDVYGNYSLAINVYAESNNVKSTIPVTAIILPCYQYSLTAGKISANKTFEAQKTPYKTCINQDYNIPLLFENKADFRNQYDLSVKGSYASLPYESVILGKNQSAIVNLSFAPKKAGNYTVLINSESVLGDADTGLRLLITADDCYNLNIHAPERINVKSKLSIPIFLENTGTQSPDVIMKVSGSQFVSLDKTAASVNKNASVNLLIDYKGQNVVNDVVFAVKLNNGDIKSKTIRLVFGKPFFYTYKAYIIVAVILLIILVLLVIKEIKSSNKKPHKIKRPEELDKIKEKVESSDIVIVENAPLTPSFEKKQEKPKKERKKMGSILKTLLYLFLLILVFAFVFSLPIHTVSPSLSNDMIGKIPEQKWEANRILRTDFGQYFNYSTFSMESTDKATVWFAGNTVYFKANGNWTGSNFLDLTVTRKDNSTKTEKIFFTIEQARKESYVKHGKNVYKTAGYFAYDYVQVSPYYWHVIVIVVIIILIDVLLGIRKMGPKKPKEKNKVVLSKNKEDHQLTKIRLK